MNEEEYPKLTLADGTELSCSLFGRSLNTGKMYIEIHGLGWREACEIFDDPSKTATMSYPFEGGPVERKGYTVFEGIDILEGGAVRVTMRRRFEGEEGDAT